MKKELNEGKEIKILTSNKLLTRLAVLLAYKKYGNHSCKLKIEISKKCIYFIKKKAKSLKNSTTI